MENISPYEYWHNISDEIVASWLSPENLASKNKRIFQGFEITDSIDGRLDKNVEISLVKITKPGQYPQHVHNSSDAYLIIVSGQGTFLSGKQTRSVRSSERIDIPKGMPHGFDLVEGEALEFISIQSPPIKNENSDEEDFHLSEKI
ncbi:MAG: hypothetical protein WC027_03570 [Candidatus Paceibacterota bacterium]